MLTIPTTELVNCITETLAHIQDPKHSETAGIVLTWGGEELHFAAYDVLSGAEVTWVPGEGAEGAADDESAEEIAWGGDDVPWRIFIDYDSAKEIVKLFKLPAKFWRYPVKLKVNGFGTKLTVERDDMARGERLLVVSTYNDVLKRIPDIHTVATSAHDIGPRRTITLPAHRLAPFGLAARHGDMLIRMHGEDSQPIAITVGSRVTGFVYIPGKAGYSVLRNGAGVHVSHPAAEDAFDGI